jgi:hypothetical protein
MCACACGGLWTVAIDHQAQDSERAEEEGDRGE